METAKCTTRKGKLPHYADGGLIGAIRRMVMPKGEAQKQSPPDKPTMAPMVRGSLDPKNALREREEAAGLKAGGAIRGKGGPTSDDIPIMASNGEFMIKAKAVAKLGVPALEALNAIADKPGDKKPTKAGHGAVRKMATGGLILGDDGVYRVNSAGDVKVPGRQYGVTNPRAATPVSTLPAPQMPPDPGTIKVDPSGRATAPGQQYRLGGPATPTPGTALVTTGLGRSFTPPTIPNPQVEIPSNYTPPQVNSKTGAYTNVPPVAEPPAAAAPKATGPGAINRMNTAFTGMTGMGGEPSRAMGAVGRAGATAVKALGRLAAPLGVIKEGVDVGKVAADPNASGIDVATQASQGAARLASAGVGAAAGAAAGSVIPVVGTAIGGIAGGLLGYYGANKAIEAGRSAVGVDPRAPADLAPSLATPSPAATVLAVAPAAPGAVPAQPVVNPTPEAAAPASGAVRRVGNSYSGTNVSGPVTFTDGAGQPVAARGGYASLDTSQGYAQDLKDLARIDATKAAEQANAKSQEAYAQNAMLQDRALRGNRTAGAIRAANIATATTQRGQDQQAQAQGAIQKLAQQKFGLDAQTAGLDNTAKVQMQAAQAKLLAAKTPEEKLAAEENLRALQGKYEKAAAPQKFTVINLPDTEGQSGRIGGGQAVIDANGQIVTQGNASPALPPGMVKQIGTSGGKPVYLDKNGKQVIAKG